MIFNRNVTNFTLQQQKTLIEDRKQIQKQQNKTSFALQGHGI